jgi:hypothetical protein
MTVKPGNDSRNIFVKAIIIAIVGLVVLGVGVIMGELWATEGEREDQIKLEAQRIAITNLSVGIVAERVGGFLEETGFPLEAVEIEYIQPIEDVEESTGTIVTNTAIPVVRDGDFEGVLTLSKDVEADPQLLIVEAFPQQELAVYLDLIRGLLREKDHLIRITWKVGEQGWFETYAVLDSEDGKLKFEPMLFFTGRTSERTDVERTLTETTVTWSGEIKNHLGVRVISWTAKVSFKADGSRILGRPYGSFDRRALGFLWQIDDERTDIAFSAKSELPVEDTVLETQVATITLGWSSGFAEAEVASWGTIKGAGAVGSISQVSIELRGDGSAWSHGEHIPWSR